MKNKLLSLVITLIFIVLFSKPVLASPNSFEVPTKQYLLKTSIEKELQETVVVKNLLDEKQTLRLNWSVNSKVPTRYADFGTPSQTTFEIQPFSLASVPIKFVSPSTFKPGDYYAILNIVSEKTKEKIPVDFTIRYLGQLTEEIEQTSVSLTGNKLLITLENKGNITTKVSGKVKVSNFFGKVIMSKNIDQFDLKASEKSQKSFVLNSKFPGKYTVETSLVFGEKETTQTSLRNVWFNKILFWSVFVLLVIFFLFIVLYFIKGVNVKKIV